MIPHSPPHTVNTQVHKVSVVSMMVDDALEEMRTMLESNKAVKDFVNGFYEE